MMAFCAWCGNQVPEASYALCPRCGNHTNGAQRVAGAATAGSGAQSAGIVIGLIVGGLVLVAIVGILAAIAIPNLLTALQRSRQKRTLADMRTVVTALEAYHAEHHRYPPGHTTGELSSALAPTYLRALPSVDGWGTQLMYECWPEGECTSYGIASAGGDKTFEHDSLQEYESQAKTTKFDADLVLVNGKFVQYPEGVQVGGR
jgi:type II secretory pathway pseudopilin PulG